MNKTEKPPMQTRSLKRRKKNRPPSKQLLDQHLIYDPMTGLWRRKLKTHPNGKLTGFLDATGYLCVSIYGAPYLAHRLAWLYITGEWPANGIDHKDGNPSNNAFANLRDVTPRINSENQRRARSDNSNGLLGVTNSGAKFRAGIQISGKKLHLGSFDTPNSAHQAYLSAKRRMHEGNTL